MGSNKWRYSASDLLKRLMAMLLRSWGKGRGAEKKKRKRKMRAWMELGPRGRPGRARTLWTTIGCPIFNSSPAGTVPGGPRASHRSGHAPATVSTTDGTTTNRKYNEVLRALCNADVVWVSGTNKTMVFETNKAMRRNESVSGGGHRCAMSALRCFLLRPGIKHSRGGNTSPKPYDNISTLPP